MQGYGVRITPLQWGRDHLIAEMMTAPIYSLAAWRLQWGRDHLIAEMPARARRNCSGWTCFNGAAII